MRLVLFITIALTGLSWTFSESRDLSRDLEEISGWVFVNDSTLIAHNDGGHEAKLFVLNLDGSIRHKVLLTNVTNIDFEDITYDGNAYLYLGDFGNNRNRRQDLAIYKIAVAPVLQNEDTEGRKIAFSYPEQTAFPPTHAEMYYDCEAMAYYHDSLYLFTKNRTSPFDGKCMVYKLPVKPGTYEAKKDTYLVIGKRDWYRDAVTAADIRNDKLYLLTYNRVIVHSFHHGKAKYLAHHTFNPITQKEALAVSPDNRIYVADEHHKLLGGGHVYVLNEPKPAKK